MGVSRDSVKANAAFAEKHGLGFPLLCDAGGAAHQSLGLIVEKTMYGKPVKGIDRTTVLIDPDGVVRKVWRGVKVAGHAEEVLGTLTVLAQGSG